MLSCIIGVLPMRSEICLCIAMELLREGLKARPDRACRDMQLEYQERPGVQRERRPGDA